MAVTLVQNANTNHSFGSGNTVVTPGSTTKAGSMLVLAVTYNSVTTAASISDSASNTWVVGNTVVTGNDPPVGWNDSAEGSAFIAWVLSAAPVTAVTLAVAGSYAADVTLSEWTGLGSFTSGGGASGASGGATTITTPDLTLATATDVVIAASYLQFEGTATPSSPLGAFSSDATGFTAWGQPGAAGSFTPTYGNPSQRDWAMAAAAFTPPPAPPPDDHVRSASSAAALFAAEVI